MNLLGLQLLIGFINLTIGLGIGWYACRSRRPEKRPAALPPSEDAVLSLLDEIRETMSDQVFTWDALQQLIAKTPNLSANDLGMHLRANRLYGRLLKSYGDQLAHYDPERQIVPQDLTENVAASRSEIGSLTDVLEKLESQPDESALRELARRLSELERSNQTLREELSTAQSKITEQTARLQDAVTQALHDHLTELPNRRCFDQKLQELDAAFRQSGRPFCVLLIDLDHFKRLNDSFGHDAGDAVLRVAARVMDDACGPDDVLFRYGGEEFAVLAADTEIAEAAELAERIRTHAEQAAIVFGERTLKFTCSIGLAQAAPESTGAEVIRAADDALYVAKDAGRNVIHVAPRKETDSEEPQTAQALS